MIRVHHLEQSRSQRVLWLLEELQCPYEVVRYARDHRTLRAPKGLALVHPLGRSPIVEEDGRVLAESGAILEYLVERHDPQQALGPGDDLDERVRYRYWMHYAEGSLMPPLLMSLVFRRLRKAPFPFWVRPIARRVADGAVRSYVNPEVRLHLDHVERHLETHAWFAGDRFTAADIQMSFPLEAASTRRADAERPRIAGFLERIRIRPAYRRALERAASFGSLE